MVLEPAFDALSLDQRAVLALHYSMGYSIAETADALDFVGSVLNAVADTPRRDTPQRPATWFAPLLPAAGVLAVTAVIAIIALLSQDAPISVDPSQSPSGPVSATPAASPSPLPTSSPDAGDRLLEAGDTVEMPAIDDLGEWGRIRLERGDEVQPSDSAWSTYDDGSVIIEVHVTYIADRSTEQTFGLVDWGLRIEDDVAIPPARRDPERPIGDSLVDQTSAVAGSIAEGWIALEVPLVEERSGVLLTYQGGVRPGGANSAPLWEVLVRERARNAQPVEGADLLEAGDATLVPAVTADGPFGMITLDRGYDVGGYPLVLDPSSATHFFIEILATYELDSVGAGEEFGELDWRVEGADGPVDAELLTAFPPVPGRIGLGQFPVDSPAVVEDPQTQYRGWMIYAVPRNAANTELELVYQPAGVADVTRIPLRNPVEAPAPVAAEWPYEEPVFVARDGLPFTVIESSEADTLFIDADACTNPEGGYTVSYPDSWYTNTALENVPACSWFSPTFYELNDSGDRPEEIAIEMRVFEGAVGFIWVDLYSEEIALDGYAARRSETGMTKDAATPTDQFQYAYLASLDAEPDGRKLWAFTGTEYGGDYELNMAVMDRIMASLEFTE